MLLRRIVATQSKCIRCLSATSEAPKVVKRDGALKRFIVDKIRTSGPITVAEYMKTAISAPDVGYYGQYSDSQKLFGSSGDFVTAPELTQMFGEMIGVWVNYELANTGHRGPWQLVECGPGTGQLMSDLLSALARFNEKDVSVHLVETSNALIEQQEKMLCVDNSTPVEGKPYIKTNKSRTGAQIYWYNNVDDIPEGFTVFVANEFLDALPVHQFVKDGSNRWHEVYVNIDGKNELTFMNSRGENLHTKGLLPESIRSNEESKAWEISPEAGTYVNQVTERIIRSGGFGLIIDYGHDGRRKDLSLRAYSKHDQVHPLSNPGQIDLTADVNFAHLKGLVEDRALVFGPTTQRDFLSQLGVGVRLRRLLRVCDDRQKQEHLIKAYNYLMGEMGEKFLVMTLFPKTLAAIMERRGAPVGFVSKEQMLKDSEISVKDTVQR